MESSSPRDLPVSERYALGPVLGHGSYGVVYRAFDKVRGQPVALKKLHRTTPHALYRFKTEFRSVMHLQHPNLVRLHELRAEGEDWFLSMELVEGVNFLDWVRAGATDTRAAATLDELTGTDESFPPDAGERRNDGVATPGFDEARLRDAFRQLAQAVAALHATGTLHRDIKPTNVLVTPEGRVVLLDFSLVTEIEPEEQSRVMGGTPLYMAPEHVTSAPLTGAADWYGLGVMLYEALTGLRPFTGTRLEILAQKAQARPSSPAEHLPGLPGDLVALCEELLDVDPERRPNADEILRRLGGGPEPHRSRSVFVGRETQLLALGAAMDRARRRAVVRIVDAPSGMGKSALVRQFLRELPTAHPGVVALVGRCYEREAVRYKGLDSLVDALARHLKALAPEVQEAVLPRHAHALVRLFPVLGSVQRMAARKEPDLADPVEERRRGFTALRELLARIADRWPLVLFIDDVQWSDADSAALVSELFRPPDAPTALLVLACRREDLARAPMLGRLLELARDERAPLDIGFVHVDELSLDESRALAGQLASTDANVERIVAEAKGNPYFVDQLARRSQGRAPVVSLDAVIRERVAELPEPARRLLETIAIAGRPIPRSLATRAAGVETDASAWDALLGAHLVRPGGTDEDIEAWHDRVRESVVAGQDATARKDCHRRLAGALEAEPSPDAEAVAVHLVAAGEDTRAAEWCVRAGDAAMRALAFDRASRHYGDALARGADPWHVRVARAEAFAAAGRGAEAAREQLAAAEHAPGAAAQRLRGDAALQLLLQGHVNEGMDVLTDALARIGLTLPRSPWSALLSLVARRAFLALRGRRFRPRAEDDLSPRDLARIDTCWSGAVGLAVLDQLRSAELQARGLGLALRAGEPLRIARALSLEFLHVAVSGSRRAAAAERLIAETGALVREVDDARIAVGYTVNRGIAAFLLGRFAEARELMERADEEFRTRTRGNTWERDNLNRFYVRVLTLQGDLRRLVPFTRDLIRDAEGRGDGHISIHVRLRSLHLVRMCEDDAAGVAEELDELLAAVSRPGFHFQHFVHLLAVAETDLYLDRPADAWNRVARTWSTVRRTMLLRVQATRIEGAWVRGRCAVAVLASLPVADPRRRHFAAIALREARTLGAERAGWATGMAAVLDAALARAEGRSGASARLQEAATLLDEAGMRMHAAAARLRAGEWSGRPDVGARAWFVEQGVKDPERFAQVFVPGV